MILPSGYLYLCGYLPFTIAILSNNGPRRPVYIVIEIIIFPADENKPDRLRTPPSPVERPTVPKAEATSNNVCIRLMFYVKTVLSFLPRTADHNATIIIANVVVLIPPPVLPGDAPITIRTISTNRESKAISPIFTELNPAVLALTE